MKLLTNNSNDKSANQKRKCEFEDGNLQSKRYFMNPKFIGADVLQENIQKEYMTTGISTLSTSHCKKYPITSEIIDGIVPFSSASSPNVASKLCSRCLNGESGHWKHVQLS